ncbi:peptidoglycan recognition protein 1-like [Trichogramma pretiosum]|uniref:peptidoglycan recognition protein 1-like n=1 Tax=Trichogramma pretiosum TaxID=7493 RepID=UPI0006C98039|nr:peptidoglycan recognition protein 1-like [Trichogramma pretiosum]
MTSILNSLYTITYFILILVSSSRLVLSKSSDDSKYADENSDEYTDYQPPSQVTPRRFPHIISRKEWNASAPSFEIDKFKYQPVQQLQLHKNDAEVCQTLGECKILMRYIQSSDIKHKGWSDLGGNFYIAADSIVFEGRGWDNVGDPSRRNFDSSLEFVIIGKIKDALKFKNVVESLIYVGAEKGKLTIGIHGIDAEWLWGYN